MKWSAPRFGRQWRGALLILAYLALTGALLLGGCLPEPPAFAGALTVTPSLPPTPSPSPTATIVWFPATPTFTPYPTEERLPTPIMNPGVGLTLYADNFSAPAWAEATTPAGSVAYGKNELTLAISQPQGELATLLPGHSFANFFLQIDVLPSLCRGEDNFGVLFRAGGTRETYRVLVNCRGEVRAEREYQYSISALRDWAPSGQVVPGMLLSTRLGIWAVGSEVRVFINDVYQFSVRDLVYSEGQIGLAARAAGDTPLTVSYSNLSVRSVDPALVPTTAPTPTISPTPANTRAPTATSRP